MMLQGCQANPLCVKEAESMFVDKLDPARQNQLKQRLARGSKQLKNRSKAFSTCQKSKARLSKQVKVCKTVTSSLRKLNKTKCEKKKTEVEAASKEVNEAAEFEFDEDPSNEINIDVLTGEEVNEEA